MTLIELRFDDPLSQWHRLEGKIARIGNHTVALSPIAVAIG